VCRTKIQSIEGSYRKNFNKTFFELKNKKNLVGGFMDLTGEEGQI
jgi:hypothetical protein